MNKGLTKRILSLVCAAAVMLSVNITPVFATTDSVEIYAAESCGAFLVPPQKISVSADSAESFGYTDKDGIITALDAMTAMYAAAYGDDFKNSPSDYLETSESGYITKAGGIETSAVGFMINGRTPNNGVYNETYHSYNAYTIAEAPIADGDVFESFLYVDTDYWTDTYSFFDNRTVTAALGESVSLTLSSFMTLYGAYKEEEITDNTNPEADIEIKKYVDGTNDIVLCTTDADGKAEFTADTAGTSIIYAETDEGVPAWCELTVEAPDAAAIAENIATTITAPYSSWEILDLAAYGSAPTLSAEEIGSLTDAATAANSSITDKERVVLELTAAGINATAAVDSNGETVNLIKLISDTSENNLGYVTAALFALLAYDSGNYTVNDGLTREKLIDIILSERNEDGVYGYSWGGNNYVDYDSTAMALPALAPYTDDPEVKNATEAMLSALSAAQGENGSWGSANTDAMVICGLAAMGVDIDSSTDFIKNGKTAVDGLLTYTVPTNDGFYYTDPNTANALATEQGFRALAAYLGAKNTGKAFSVYSFRDFSEKEITVTFEMYGDKVHGSKTHSGSYPIWIEETSAKVLEDSTVMSLFCSILDENGFTYEGADKGYISYITHPDGTKLGEFDNGIYSGWLYTVNGDEPDVSMSAYTLKDKDKIRVYFTDDWRKTYNPNKKPSGGSSGSSGGSGFSSGTSTSASGDVDSEENGTEGNAAETEDKSNVSFNDVSDEHWAYTYITDLASRGIINGDENGSFNPEANISRAEFCAILSRCSDADISETESPFSDVDSDSWYSGYVVWAYNQGIVNGMGEDIFAPEAPISRQDLSVMIMRYADKFNVSLPSSDEAELRDADTVSDYASDAVARLSGCGIINGDENGNFNPENSAARAEAAKIIYLLFYR